ncbi:MAG TPA: nuclear transport factor 2 family protein [Roseiarcus sp.]
MTPRAVAQWHAIVRSRDAAALDALLADDVVFFSPVVFRPQVGKALTKAYLAAALEVLGNETFRYVGEWTGADSAVLEFVAMVDGVEINGADFIAWNEAGRIVSFKVMVRPLKAIEMVRAKMAAQLERAGGA